MSRNCALLPSTNDLAIHFSSAAASGLSCSDSFSLPGSVVPSRPGESATSSVIPFSKEIFMRQPGTWGIVGLSSSMSATSEFLRQILHEVRYSYRKKDLYRTETSKSPFERILVATGNVVPSSVQPLSPLGTCK